MQEHVSQVLQFAEPQSVDEAVPYGASLQQKDSHECAERPYSERDCGGLLITWHDLEKAFLDMQPRFCDAAWCAGNTPFSPGRWTFSFRADGDRRYLRRTLRTAGLKLRSQIAPYPLPGGLATRSADMVESWLTALAYNQVLSQRDNQQWEIGGRVIYALPAASALLCRRLMRLHQRTPSA